ncbi:MAG: chemotaxis protein CheA [Stigonema ocellatum SAG 48.90 = DSM 106950]|nr:chemotaxis protein CheA [Stigonema ocellatum SAG 48.90 = DSM 106950]
MNLVEINDDDDDVKAFLEESYENLAQIERDIIDLEKNSTDREILVRIYRSIHTIKGNCGFLPFPKLESVAHAGESLLGRLRDGTLVVNREITTALLQTLDTILLILNHIEEEGKEGDRDYSELIENLNQLQVQNDACNKEQVSEKQANNYITTEQPSSQEINQVQEVVPETTRDDTLSETSIRVNVKLLDWLMNLVGELVLARNQFLQIANGFEDTAFTTTCQRLNFITSELQSVVMKTRMQPISSIWQKFYRLARDLAIACGKQVQLEIQGAETELDKSIIEAIKDPLTHLVRNCIDHGIETPQQRTAIGKPVVGRLLLQSFHHNGKVNIQISDDGRGINLEQLKQKAQQLGLISSIKAASLSETEALNLIFLPGLSTASQVTNLSGRGMGMDVFKTNIEKINGTVEVHSQLGKGTTFQIKIPLTLAIIPALIVNSGGNRYAIPQSSIQELVRLEGSQAEAIETLYDVPVLRLREKLLALVYLNQIFQIQDRPAQEKDENLSFPTPYFQDKVADEKTIYIVVIEAEDYRFGLVVDAIDDTQDIVVKPLGRQLKHITVFSGATILGDGKVALIIDAINLANSAGITLLLQKQLSDTTTVEDLEKEDRQMVLLFLGPQGARMGIPLTFASRLEEFPRSVVEKVGNQYVVQYRDTILSLIDLHTVFSSHSQGFTLHSQNPSLQGGSGDKNQGGVAGEGFFTEDDTIQVVVVSLKEEQLIGLVVDCILDIVEERLERKGIASRLGVNSLAVIQGQVTEMIDVENVIRIANPYLFELSG